MLNNLQSKFHKFAGSSKLVAILAKKINNQLECVIAQHLGPSANMADNGEELMLKRLAPAAKFIVDVGANRGDWLKIAYGYNAKLRAVAVEPNPTNAGFLKSFFRDQNIDVFECALGEKDGLGPFVIGTGEGRKSALKSNFTGNKKEEEVNVKISKLDSILGRDEIIDYLKVDAEGNDYRVLQGARDLLIRKKIRFLHFEYNDNWLNNGSRLIDAITYLNGCGYCVKLLSGKGPIDFDSKFWGEYYRYSLFCAWPIL